MTKSFVAKTWWHWNKNQNNLWKIIWEDKYTNQTSKFDLVIARFVGRV
jgi:hypothetical protein